MVPRVNKLVLGLLVLVLVGVGFIVYLDKNKDRLVSQLMNGSSLNTSSNQELVLNPLSIEALRQGSYPGSDITIEKELPSGGNFKRYVASYISDGLKIKGLLAVPNPEVGSSQKMPQGGYPAIIFNHGYIPPETYRRESKYVAYVAGFASKGYVVFMSDYRGHEDSEGQPSGAYYSPGYTVDVLNALSSVKKLTYVNPDKIGMWGHSMGGNITLRAMVVSKEIKVGVIWGGVVGSYQQMAEDWHRTRPWRPSTRESQSIRPGRQNLIDTYGDWNANPDFWDSITPIAHVAEISGPLQLHHGLSDEEVPVEFSQSLYDVLIKAGKVVELYTYQGADHNLAGSAFGSAMSRSVAFFDRYLK